MPLHKLLRKILAAFQLRAFGLGPDNGNMLYLFVSQEKIMDAFHQRFLRAYQYKVDAILEHGLFYSFKISHLNIQVFPILTGAGITGCNKKPFAFGALSYFPGEGAFPSART